MMDCSFIIHSIWKFIKEEGSKGILKEDLALNKYSDVDLTWINIETKCDWLYKYFNLWNSFGFKIENML